MTEKILTVLADALENDATQSQNTLAVPTAGQPHAPGPDTGVADSPSGIDYRSAYRRARLPDGIEALTGKPSTASDDEKVAGIRALMEAQTQEQRQTAVARCRPLSTQPARD